MKYNPCTFFSEVNISVMLIVFTSVSCHSNSHLTTGVTTGFLGVVFCRVFIHLDDLIFIFGLTIPFNEAFELRHSVRQKTIKPST